MCMCILCVCLVTHRNQKKALDPVELSPIWLHATMWVLGTKPRSSAGATRSFSHQTLLHILDYVTLGDADLRLGLLAQPLPLQCYHPCWCVCPRAHTHTHTQNTLTYAHTHAHTSHLCDAGEQAQGLCERAVLCC